MMRILIVNGPNLNLLGVREPDIYGAKSYRDLLREIRSHAKTTGLDVVCFQSNHEGGIIDWIQRHARSAQGLVINPGALTHYSYALRDCIKGVGLPTIEVHISDIHGREAFRSVSVIKDVCLHQISGKGFAGYFEAVDELVKGQKEK
ncbi:MAG: type II 3-dehydroquinate dehydratase [bacterium]